MLNYNKVFPPGNHKKKQRKSPPVICLLCGQSFLFYILNLNQMQFLLQKRSVLLMWTECVYSTSSVSAVI